MIEAGFTTLQALKARILPAAAGAVFDWDDAIRSMGLAAASRINQHCNRVFDRTVDQVDEFNATVTTIGLRAYPVEEINTVEIRTFTGALDEYLGGYQLDQRSGLIEFDSLPGSRTDRIVVTYTGGFWCDDRGTQPAGSTAMPYDILEAFFAQVQAWVEARNLFGTVSLGKDTKSGISPTQLTSEVMSILEPYRRYA